MARYKGARFFGGLCSGIAVLMGIAACLIFVLMGGRFGFGVVGVWFIGPLVGLFVALPLLVVSEVLSAILDIAENSFKLVEKASNDDHD